MHTTWTHLHAFVQNIVAALPLEVVVALIVTGTLSILGWLSRQSYKHWRRIRFAKVFGRDLSRYSFVFGTLVVRQDLLVLAEKIATSLARFPLSKPGRIDVAFSAQTLTSGCEIRAVAYLFSLLRRIGRISVDVVSDETITSKLDLNFVAFGATSNLKTVDTFANPGNDLADYNKEIACFVSKKDGSSLHPKPESRDYGIILKIHPSQFPERTWICCAGIGEWGTSGAAWFLANRWKEIAKDIRKDESFVCVVEVTPQQDESARRLSLNVRAV
jgi:hypothetical protein